MAWQRESNNARHPINAVLYNGYCHADQPGPNGIGGRWL